MPSDRLVKVVDGLRAVLLEAADPSSLAEFCHPDVTYENPPDALETGVRSGREEFWTAWARILASFRYNRVDVIRDAESGEYGAISVVLGTIGRESGAAVDRKFSSLLQFEDGLLKRYQWSFDPDWAFDELERIGQ